MLTSPLLVFTDILDRENSHFNMLTTPVFTTMVLINLLLVLGGPSGYVKCNRYECKYHISSFSLTPMMTFENVTANVSEETPNASDVINNTLTINESGGGFYSPLFGTHLAMPEWEALVTIFSLTVVIASTIVGNILVIISVFTHAPLKVFRS